MRPPLPALLAALALGLLVPFAAACGEEREGLIGPNRSADMQEHLDRIDELTAAGRCEGAIARLRALRDEVADLPQSVDAELRTRLGEGVANLETQVPDDCGGQETTDTQPEETTPETVPEETVPEETVPEETVPEETTPPETTPPETTPPDDGEEPTTPGQGGTPPGQGGTPPGQQDDSGGEEAPQFGVVLP